MGRRRQHNAHTAHALLQAAEHILHEQGIDALSVRSVAARVATSTRAVYSVFGSKEQMLVALSVRAFEMLATGLAALPLTDDPAADVVAAGVTIFRPFALEHPALFRIAFQRAPAWMDMPGEVFGAATSSFRALILRFERLQAAGLLGPYAPYEAAHMFDALCEGLAVGELRGSIPPDDPERLWHGALGSLVAGFAAVPARP